VGNIVSSKFVFIHHFTSVPFSVGSSGLTILCHTTHVCVTGVIGCTLK